MRRTIIILTICILALTLMAASCDPDPGGGWTGNDDPFTGIHATETYGAEQWSAQLTALAETEEP